VTVFLFRKLGQWLDMLVGVFVERTDDRFSVERRLQYDRQQRAEQLKRQRTLAVDVGAYAVELAQDLGEAVVEVEDLRSQARDHVARANAAKARGDARAEEEELARASQLAEELAEAEAHLSQLNAEKDAALKDKEEAYAIIEDGIAQLRAQARQDSRLARRAGMAELRERSLEMREKLAQMIPEDRDDTREQIEQKLQKREAKLEARRELTDRLISRERDQRVRARQEISSKGRTNLSELFAEVGYTPTAVDAAAPAAASTAQQGSTAAAAAEPPAIPGPGGGR
jgi:phage shock protein A